MDDEKEAIKRHDRMRRLYEERKLEVIGQIMIDPEEKEMFIHLPAGDRLFVMDNDFIHALKNVIKYDDDARTMLTVADIHAVEARRMRREAEARLEIEAKENKQTGDRLRRKLEQADEKAKTEKAKKKKAKK
jgi:hypothetical protein